MRTWAITTRRSHYNISYIGTCNATVVITLHVSIMQQRPSFVVCWCLHGENSSNSPYINNYIYAIIHHALYPVFKVFQQLKIVVYLFVIDPQQTPFISTIPQPESHYRLWLILPAAGSEWGLFITTAMQSPSTHTDEISWEPFPITNKATGQSALPNTCCIKRTRFVFTLTV